MSFHSPKTLSLGSHGSTRILLVRMGPLTPLHTGIFEFIPLLLYVYISLQFLFLESSFTLPSLIDSLFVLPCFIVITVEITHYFVESLLFLYIQFPSVQNCESIGFGAITFLHYHEMMALILFQPHFVTAHIILHYR